jgi:hypothetical protein
MTAQWVADGRRRRGLLAPPRAVGLDAGDPRAAFRIILPARAMPGGE